MTADEIRNFVDLVERVRVAQKDYFTAVKQCEPNRVRTYLLGRAKHLEGLLDKAVTAYHQSRLPQNSEEAISQGHATLFQS